jgi:hypothetical protein
MSKDYSTAPIAIGQSEFTATITYTITPGCPAWGGSRFEPPINPPEEASIEFHDVELVTSTDKRWAPKSLGTGVKVKEIPDWLAEMIFDEFEDEIMASQDDPDADRADYLNDRARDESAMEGL